MSRSKFSKRSVMGQCNVSFWSHALRHNPGQDVFEGSSRASMLLASEGPLSAEPSRSIEHSRLLSRKIHELSRGPAFDPKRTLTALLAKASPILLRPHLK